VQQYARQLAAAEVKIAAVRDRQSQLRNARTKLESELNSLIEKADF
jgi:septal ring factor EnvC (AmiA/AmiB activator)